MSVEADTMHYYAAIDRQERFDRAVENLAERKAEDIQSEVYEWIKQRFGEDAAIALMPEEPYNDADTLSAIHDAREYFRMWRDAQAKDEAFGSLEG